MTTINRPIKRETRSTVKGRPLVVTLYSTYLSIREKGRRYAYIVTYDQIRTAGARNKAEQTRRERAERRAKLRIFA